jgi:hypothetical protein
MSETGPRTRAAAAAAAIEVAEESKRNAKTAIGCLSALIFIVILFAVIAFVIAIGTDSSQRELAYKADLLVSVTERITRVVEARLLSSLTSEEERALNRDLLALRWLAKDLHPAKTGTGRHHQDRETLLAYREWEVTQAMGWIGTDIIHMLLQCEKQLEDVCKWKDHPWKIASPTPESGDGYVGFVSRVVASQEKESEKERETDPDPKPAEEKEL